MYVLDIRKDEQLQPTEVQWVNNIRWNLIRRNGGVAFSGISLDNNLSINLVCNKGEAENLIKALQAAIDLGWVK